MIVVVDVAQQVVRQCGSVGNNLPYPPQIPISVIGFDPMLAGWQADANCTTEECLDGRYRSSKLIWFKNFHSRIAN